MNKNKIRWVLATLTIIFVALSFSSCQYSQAQRQLPGNKALPVNKSIKGKPSTNTKVWLNQLDMGTTRNLSILGNKLKRIFKEREKNATFRENTSEVEKTVFIEAEPFLKVSAIVKVLRALVDSGASPLMLSFETMEDAPSFKDWKNSANGIGNSGYEEPKPNPLTLIVTIGKSETEISTEKGIVLRLNQTTIPRQESHGSDGLVVDIDKEGRYLIGGESAEKEALENTFKTFLRNVSSENAMYVSIGLENNADKISFGSVLEVARKAYNAGIKELELRIYFPPVKN